MVDSWSQFANTLFHSLLSVNNKFTSSLHESQYNPSSELDSSEMLNSNNSMVKRTSGLQLALCLHHSTRQARFVQANFRRTWRNFPVCIFDYIAGNVWTTAETLFWLAERTRRKNNSGQTHRTQRKWRNKRQHRMYTFQFMYCCLWPFYCRRIITFVHLRSALRVNLPW